MLRKLTLSVIVLSMLQRANAQEGSKADSMTLEEKPTPALSISGGADLYYRYDFAKNAGNNYTSFTSSHNSFELGMATVKLNYKTSKTEVVADLGFGKRAQDFSYNDAGILAGIKQLYISYSPKEWLKFTAGSWATHVGYELVDAQANRNYSMSYMFTNGPFFHTGVRADITYKNSGFMIGIANPTDYKYVPKGVLNSKFLLAQYSFTPSDKFKAYVNYVGGKNIDSSKSNQVDLVLTSKLSDKFSLGYNGTVNFIQAHITGKQYEDAKNWWGSALYINYDPTEKLGFTLRNEYFSDKNRFKVYSMMQKGGSVFATTLSANIRVEKLVIIPEVRMDNASENTLFTKANGQSTKRAGSALLAVVYQF